MKTKRILVTGNMGYVGPELIKRLRTSYPRSELIGIDMGYFAHCFTGADVFPERYVDHQYIQDVRNIDHHFLNNVDAVVHLAAISNDPMGNAYESATNEINYVSSVNLAEYAKKAGVSSFVFASSCSVYGYAEGDARDEDSELNPLTAYAKSKINTENATQVLADNNFTITSLRFPTACGMSDRLRLDLVLNDFVASAVATNRITILSDGTPWRPLIDIKDMARAIDWAISRKADQDTQFLAINAGRTEWNYQVKDLAEAVKEHIPNVEIDINKNAAPDKRSYRVDFSKYATFAPDYLPQVDLFQSIKELKQGLEKMSFNNSDFRESQFMRLKVLANHKEQGRLNEKLEWV